MDHPSSLTQDEPGFRLLRSYRRKWTMPQDTRTEWVGPRPFMDTQEDWVGARPLIHKNEKISLPVIIRLADLALARYHEAGAYQLTPNQFRADLKASKDQLEYLLEPIVEIKIQIMHPRRALEDTGYRTLAKLNVALGNLQEAVRIYESMCPSSPPQLPEKSSWLNYISLEIPQYELDLLLEYIEFLVERELNLDTALEILNKLLANYPMRYRFEWYRTKLCSIRLLNFQRNFSSALDNHAEMLADGYSSIPSVPQILISFHLEGAISLTGLGRKEEANAEFLKVAILSSIVLGMWHSQTIRVLEFYGNTQMKWGNNRAAAILLRKCYHGIRCRLGHDHPKCEQIFAELKACEGVEVHNHLRKPSNDLNFRGDFQHPIADTGLDAFPMIKLLSSTALLSSQNVSEALVAQDYLEDVRGLDYSRGLTITLFRIGYVQLAIDRTKSTIDGVCKKMKDSKKRVRKATVETLMLLRLDLIKYSLSIENLDMVLHQYKEIFLYLAETPGSLKSGQIAGLYHHLGALNLHFPYDVIRKNPLPITVCEAVGAGTFAVVESVSFDAQLFARKSVALPRYNQVRIREAIQNEITIIRALKHPHIIQIFLTYEEKTRFFIVMQPLATCDLEAWLIQFTSTGKNLGQQPYKELVWKWLRCLANTVAFIHSRGIRHKDIKTRNILVLDDELIFADFGSSHAFLDGEASTTEGPSYGHTVMYCAPEVIECQKRNRTADVFSLGCVFTEIVTGLDGRSLSHYAEYRTSVRGGVETHAYYATGEKVAQWFNFWSTPKAKTIYQMVIEPMIRADPKERATAEETLENIRVCYQAEFSKSLDACSKCSTVAWGIERTKSPSEIH